jgi:hypothetical protein
MPLPSARSARAWAVSGGSSRSAAVSIAVAA